jgi:predicted choloylglycine hydrolase
MKRALAVLSLAALVMALFGGCNNSDPVYGDYDLKFRGYLARAKQTIGKEIIKVERLSEQFTVPQKLIIKGTPYEVGLTIGHIGRQAKARLPMLAENERIRNQQVAELYRRIYPQHLELVRGVAAAYEQPAEDIDLAVFDRSFTPQLWCGLLQNERFYQTTSFGKLGDPTQSHHCSVASYFTNGHQLVGRNFDISSDRPHYFRTLEMVGTYKTMGHTVYDITGELDDGINEKGLSLCVTANVSLRRGADGWIPDTKAYASREPYPHPAIPMWHMMQIVMQTCATVDEALALLRTVQLYFLEEGSHWLLADATGKAVVVEWTAGDHRLLVFDQGGPYELLTNCAFQEGEEALLACPRYRRAKPLLEKGVHNTADMLEVMKVMRVVAGPGRSLWTSIMDLNSRTFEVRYFKEFERKYEFGF